MSRAYITTVVFDLDDTLYDCYRQRVGAAHRHACRALLRLGLARRVGRKLTHATLLRLRLRLFRRDPDIATLDRRVCDALLPDPKLARRYARIGRQAYLSYPVRNLRLFRDTLPTLRRLSEAGVAVYLLTAGRLPIQQAKVRVLGLKGSPWVKRVFYTGLLGGRGKKAVLTKLKRDAGTARSILVVGDRPDSEIWAARELGLWAVRRRGGEFQAREPRNRLERSHYEIRRLSELFTLPFRYGEHPG